MKKNMPLGGNMKKLLILGLGLITTASFAQTETYSYAQMRAEQGMATHNTAYVNGQYQNGGAEYAAPPSPQLYGFYLQGDQASFSSHSEAASPKPLIWYPTARQRAQAFGQPPYDTQVATEDMDEDDLQKLYHSPVYNSKAVRNKKSLYAGFQLGFGTTLGWEEKLDTTLVPMWSATLGTIVQPNVRLDAEFVYHTKRQFLNDKNGKVEYKQYNLGANIYYDFPVRYTAKPFIGAGIWAVKGKASGKYQGSKIQSINSSMRLAFSVAAGVTYPLTDVLNLIAMGRARYIFTDSDLYNLEGLFGFQYHF